MGFVENEEKGSIVSLAHLAGADEQFVLGELFKQVKLLCMVTVL